MAQTQQAGAKTATELLSMLVYELLDAHGDTVALMSDGEEIPGWEAHLEYLRRLQRVGRETLAHCDCLLGR
ncbi:MAG TPA: hypothetical protein VKT31_11630 [Solirubrobacteraceae bacterium]|nr:hypothetical protein [Solirubrobacteraceae bacterium]